MTSVFDKNLLDNLLRIAQQQQAPAGQATPQPPDPNQLRDTAMKLVQSLKAQVDGPVFTSNKENAAVRVTHLTSLANLLNFLAFNGIKYNGADIVLSHNPNTGHMSGKTPLPGDITFDTKIKGTPLEAAYAKYPEPDDEAGDNFQYRVNKGALLAYLRMLQEQAEKEPLMKPMVLRLFDEANAELQMNASKEKPKAEKTFPAEHDLDFLPEKLSPAQPLMQGNVPLKIKDLQSKQTFYSYVSGAPFHMDKDEADVPAKEFSKDDFCLLLNILHTRASDFEGKRGLDIDKEYLRLVSNLASQYSCEIGGSTAKNKGVNKTVGYYNEKGQLTEAGVQALQSFEWPLMPDDIDLEKMKRFAKSYSAFAKDPSSADKLTNLINGIERVYRVNVQDLAVNSVEDVDRFIFQRSGQRVQGYLQALYQTVQQADYMVKSLETIWRRSEGSPAIAPILQDLQEQKQFFNQNLFHLNKWQSKLEDIFRNLQQKR